MSSNGALLYPLFDQFVVVSIVPTKDENANIPSYEPSVSALYPPHTAPNPNVALFCFPEDIDDITFGAITKGMASQMPTSAASVTKASINNEKPGGGFFFVLTDGEGRQQFGFTRRITLGAGDAAVPHCMCVLSHWQWQTTFAQLLEIIESKIRKTLYMSRSESNLFTPDLMAGVYSILTELETYGLPLPGESVMLDKQYMLTRPKEDDTTKGHSETTDEAIYPLLECMTPPKIVSLFLALLCERRVIAVSSSLSRISRCLAAALAMLKPFLWQHIFIPVLPRPLLDYCCAPMPFLMGLHASLMLPLQMLPINETVFVDLDRDQVGILKEDTDILPSSMTQPIRVALESALAVTAGKGAPNKRIIIDAVRNFFVNLLGPYRRFFLQGQDDKIDWDRNGFIAAQPRNVRPFLQVFCASQMFERFLAEREDYYTQAISGPGPFDRALSQWEAAHPVSGTHSSGSIKDLASSKIASLKEKVQEGKKIIKDKVERNTPIMRSTSAPAPQTDSILDHHQHHPINNTTPTMQATATTTTTTPATSAAPPHGVHKKPLPAPPTTHKAPPSKPLPPPPPKRSATDPGALIDWDSPLEPVVSTFQLHQQHHNQLHQSQQQHQQQQQHNHHTPLQHQLTPPPSQNPFATTAVPATIAQSSLRQPNPFFDDVSPSMLPPPILPPPPATSNSVSKSSSVSRHSPQNAHHLNSSFSVPASRLSQQFNVIPNNQQPNAHIPSPAAPPPYFNPFFEPSPQTSASNNPGTVPQNAGTVPQSGTVPQNMPYDSAMTNPVASPRSDYSSFTFAGPDLSFDFAASVTLSPTENVPTVPRTVPTFSAGPTAPQSDWFEGWDPAPQQSPPHPAQGSLSILFQNLYETTK
eukprot:TRINITY_DN9208_c0_g1_i3.p1 TRINITY_DN9208_c0_g1~~TRINITY_DN9208_c0_g1_i3.p1  ORF type:complete len:868 (-),score=169.76 TRINITY_DN9208_c0_g1_i3:38-2641(-)